MLDAAQILADSIAVADFTKLLRDKLNITLPDVANIYKSLIAIDPTIMFTTNFDQFLEAAYMRLSGGHGYNICRYNEHHLLNDIRSPIRSIAKVHGCITQPANLIMTRTSYFDARRTYRPFFRVVESSLITNTLLFIGYSFSDPDIQLILENNYLAAPTAHTHFALVQKFEHPSIRDALRKTYNIQFIEYPRGEHERVVLMTDDLTQQVVSYRASKGIV